MHTATRTRGWRGSNMGGDTCKERAPVPRTKSVVSGAWLKKRAWYVVSGCRRCADGLRVAWQVIVKNHTPLTTLLALIFGRMLSVTFLGTSAARPTVERNVSAMALVREGETLLFECGEGTQRQMMRYGVSFALSEIFFTHFHADHFLGVIGLIRTLGLQTRTEPMVLYGPKGAKKVLGQAIQLGVERVPFGVDIREVKPGDVITGGDRAPRTAYDIHAFATEHGGGSVGYALREHERAGRFDPDKARAAGVPEGPLWGKLQKGETVELPDGRKVVPEGIVGEKRRGRTVVFTGDTRS